MDFRIALEPYNIPDAVAYPRCVGDEYTLADFLWKDV